MVGLVLNLVIALSLGFAYRFLFLSRAVRDRGLADALDSALKASVAMFVIVTIASLASAIAFRLHTGFLGKLASSIAAGVLVFSAACLLFAQVSGFPIFAGLVTCCAFLMLLLFLRESGQ